MSRSAISHAHVRARLSAAAGGARVMEEAVLLVVERLEADLDELVRAAGERYAREARAREAQGLRGVGMLRADHVAPDVPGIGAGTLEVG